MVHIEFTEPQTPEWQRWRQKCQEEQERHNKAIEAGQEAKVKGALYKGQKVAVYANPDGPFRGKCAYCESRITNPQTQPGDIEHFRPKKAVTEENGAPVMVADESGKRAHLGYYWLVYDWRNLLLSCNTCNRRQRDLASRRLVGKGTVFPIRDFRACKPGEEDREEPLLLNPMDDDPARHLAIDETGILSWQEGDDKGETTVRILGLNLRGLPRARKERYNLIRDKYRMFLWELADSPDSEKAKRLLAQLVATKDGDGVYAIAARQAIRDVNENLRLLGRLNG